MIVTVLLALVSIAMVMLGARGLTDGASAVAEKFGVPPLLIGLTVVALGTSAPEFFISLTSTLHNTADMAVGNVVGSNIFNSLLIVGVAALSAPIILNKSTVFREIPMGIAASYGLFLLMLDRVISTVEAIFLLGAFILFMYYTLSKGQLHASNPFLADNDEKIAEIKPMPWWKSVPFIIFGLVGLIWGSDIFVNSAVEIARFLAVPDAVIGLTIVAGGTSLPELATTVVAARRGHSEIAIGNVIGSNLYNILLILGVSGLISPLKLYEISVVDLVVLGGSSVLIWAFAYTRFTIERWEGGVLTACFVAYMSWLIYGM